MNSNINKIRKSFLLAFAFSCFINLSAQRGDIYNSGDLYVAPGTIFTSEAHFINKKTGKYINDGEAIFLRNFHNEGVVSFSENSNGYTRFQGSEAQEISGPIISNFKDVLFDNQGDDYSFLLSGDINVSGQVDFYRGIVDNYNYRGKFQFAEDASHITTSDRSYVEGTVTKTGTSSFMFPIGKLQMYRSGGIILLGDTPIQFTGEYQAYNSDALYPHANHGLDIAQIDDQEFWTIDGDTSDKEVLINLTYDDRITPLNLLYDYDALAILAWDPNENQWKNLGGATDRGSNTVTSVVELQHSYSAYTLGVSREKPNEDDIKIYNAVNPNDSGGNDYLRIDGLEDFPNNNVRVFNRWGVTVFDQSNYDTKGNVFRGISDGRATIERGKELPVGTYFYILKYFVPGTSNGSAKTIQGYLYLNR